MHLYVAEQICERHDLPDPLRKQLQHEWSAFYLGSVAPDFQVISSIKREVTHFYPLPPDPDDYDAFGRMLAAYPKLADPKTLSAEQAVFTAAYGAHLLYDLIWDHKILTPCFRAIEWGDRYQRYMSHNILLTYMDRVAYNELPETAGQVLSNITAAGRLPFDEDQKLAEWQALLVKQLQSAAEIQTIQIYAQRLRMEPEEFAARLDDEQWMYEFVFQHVSLDAVAEAAAIAVERSVDLLYGYLRPCFEQNH